MAIHRLPTVPVRKRTDVLWGPRERADQCGDLDLDRLSGKVLSWSTSKDHYPSDSFAHYCLRWLDTDEIGSFGEDSLAAVASAGAVVLGWAGLFLTWRRPFPCRKKRRNESLGSDTLADSVKDWRRSVRAQS